MSLEQPERRRCSVRHLLPAVLMTPSLALALGIDDLPWPLSQSVAPEVYERLATHPAAERYLFSAHINPFYLNGDFDGDGRLDTAVLIREKATQKTGIAVLHGGSDAVFILGAGHIVGLGGDDFRSRDAWHVFQKGEVPQGTEGSRPPILKGDAVYVEKTESSSAILYWDGTKYLWYQQGD